VVQGLMSFMRPAEVGSRPIGRPHFPLGPSAPPDRLV